MTAYTVGHPEQVAVAAPSTIAGVPDNVPLDDTNI